MAGKVLDLPRTRGLFPILLNKSGLRFLSLSEICRSKSIGSYICKRFLLQPLRYSVVDHSTRSATIKRQLGILGISRFQTTVTALESRKPVITIFSKDDCSLCDIAKEELKKYQDQCEVEVIDIGDEANSHWFEKYKYDIPVIHLNGKFLMKHKVFSGALQDALINANKRISEIEKKTTDSEPKSQRGLEKVPMDMMLNFFSGHYIDRCAHMRASKETIDAKMRNECSRFIIFCSLEPLLSKRKSGLGSCLKTLTFQEVSGLPGGSGLLDEVVFLGTDIGNVDWFAINLQSMDMQDAVLRLAKDDAHFGNAFFSMLKLNEVESSIAAQARGILAWHSSHAFCPACGSRSEMDEAGYRRYCGNEECETRQITSHHACYPRVDPVTMSLVISPDHSSILLGRKPVFPPGFFTCLAGFVEPGESFETSVHREVYEECGIEVDQIRYQLSQCWPFPSSIMFGCSAIAKRTDIVVDKEELEDATWFTREEAAKLLSKETNKAYKAGKHVRIAPGRHALAHHLIKRWVDGKI